MIFITLIFCTIPAILLLKLISINKERLRVTEESLDLSRRLYQYKYLPITVDFVITGQNKFIIPFMMDREVVLTSKESLGECLDHFYPEIKSIIIEFIFSKDSHHE